MVLGRLDDGEAHYRKGIAKETSSGARSSALFSKSGYARLLLQRNRRGDYARAKAIVRELEAESQELGLRQRPLYLRMVDEAMAQSGRGRGSS